jgi:urea transport system permease protein
MRHLYAFCLTLFLSLSILTPAQAESSEFGELLSGLTASKLKDRATAVQALISTQDERLITVFQALLSSDLYYRKSDKTVAVKTGTASTESYVAILDGEAVGTDGKWKKIIINNAMRRDLRTALASLQLANENPTKRLAAVEQILSQLDTEQLPALMKQAQSEQDETVQQQLKLVIATLKMKAGEGDPIEHLNAVQGNAHSSVRQVVAELASSEDKAVQQLAGKTLEAIDDRVATYGHVETLFFGLSLGSVLVLAAIGLAITFGVMGVINMAHGELIMLGAYTTYVVQLWLPELLEYSLLIAVPLAFLVSGTVGILIERGVIRFLYGRPLETLLATFGVSLILQQVVRSIFSPLNRAVATPEWMSGVWQVNEVLALTWNRLYIIIFSLLVFAALFIILKKTRLGLMVRAVSQNREMARAMGVRSSWVDAMTFGLGSGVAGVAGVALSQLTNVGPNLGQSYIIDSFMVVVFGGVGNLWGTLVAGLGLGVTNKLLEPWSGAVLAKILVLIFIILFIQKRPKGLFPQKGRAADN